MGFLIMQSVLRLSSLSHWPMYIQFMSCTIKCCLAFSIFNVINVSLVEVVQIASFWWK